ncbi:ATP-binding cassette domain-containing protein [Brachybacterium paraconglomeratum]|uniref:ATP-binding cassette domain-containing protein n=1 Tax=Brachybacterium paraconglomeratum TaxID=173362 RepID=UPI0031EE459D
MTLAPGDSVRVGRADEHRVRVIHPQVSRSHVKIHLLDDTCEVTDLDSTHGTFLAGERINGSVTRSLPMSVQLGPKGPLLHLTHAAAASTANAVLAPGGAQELVIGRDPGCDVRLDDLLVSRRHARISLAGPRPVVEDLGSANGTYVDGQRVVRAELSPDSMLMVGGSRLRVDGTGVHPVDGTEISFAAVGLGVTLPSGRTLLDDVSFTLTPGTLMAVIGGSGTGKTTLLNALTGVQPATSGQVLYDGRDLSQHLESLRGSIGVVPQEDVVHQHLTARQALGYAAELRFDDGVPAADRERRVGEVLEELGLTEHQHTRISSLSGGQRKRVSVAIELLTRPSLLVLDEPTSGLDLDLVAEVMETLRRLADDGRTVLVVTHSPEGLDLCDRLLILAPGGRVSYFGHPSEALPHFGAENFRHVVAATKTDPDGTVSRFRASAGYARDVHTPIGRLAGTRSGTGEASRSSSLRRQISVVARRQLRILWADRALAGFVAAMPFILAALVLVVPGEQGLAPPGAEELPSGQPNQILIVLTLGGVFMGLSSSIRDLVTERAIFVRERSIGLSPAAYVLAKLTVLGLLTFIQTVLLVAVVLQFRDGPESGVLLGSAIELVLALWLCALSSAALGLLVSSLVGSGEQTMPVMVVLVMVQLVLSGGLFPVTDRAVLEQLAWLSPSRWGFAAMGGTSDITAISLIGEDPLWEPSAWIWLGCLLMLCVLMAVMSWATAHRLAKRYRIRGR